MTSRPRLAADVLLAFMLLCALPAQAQNGVFIKDKMLQRLSGSLFGTGIETVPIAPKDQAAMQSAYNAVKPHCYDQSIYKIGPGTGGGACGRSAEMRAVDVAGALPPGWRVDKVQSQDVSNVVGGTGHVLLMLTSPDGNAYAMDTYMGVVEIAPLDKQTGYRWQPHEGEELAGVSATFAFGNFSGTLTLASDSCHYVVTAQGVEKYSYDNGSWVPNNKGLWYTPQVLELPGLPPKQTDDKDGPVRRTEEVKQPVSAISSYDPNHLSGPEGVGSSHFVSARDALSYTIGFENLAAASAPAAEVVVTDRLDPAQYDLGTFELGAMAVGSRTLTPPAGKSAWSTVVDLRPAKPLLLLIDASLEPSTGLATWHFTAVDPATGALPLDPTLGFLPPNVTSPQGEGWVSFSVKPKAGLATGAKLSQRARIVFDVNPPIDTNTWSNVLDAGAPSSHVKPLAAAPTGAFTVSWEGSDDAKGSGITSYAVYVSKDGGAFVPWLGQTSGTSAAFQGEFGRTYRFFSAASDAVGNQERRLDGQGQAPTDAHSATGAPLQLPPGLNHLGLPVMPDQTDPEKLLGFTHSRWARWVTSTAQYARYPAAAAAIDATKPGQAFWVVLDQAKTVAVPGRLADRSQPVMIPLATGWNAIASPFLTPLTWNATAIRVATDDAEKSLAEAAAAGWVGDYLWIWKPQTAVYQLVCDSTLVPGTTSTLAPWQGCWIKASRACRLLLPVPTGEVPATRRSQPSDGWAVSLRAACGSTAQEVVVGQSPGRATVIGYPPAPPSGDNGLRLVLLHDQEPAAVDVRKATKGDASAWELAVTAPAAGGEVVLSWPAFLREIPSGLVVELTDSASGVTRLLNTSAAYRFQAPAGGEVRRLHLAARRGRVDRADVVSLAVRPSRGGATTIDVVLGGPASVKWTVRGPGGQVVRTVAVGAQPAGRSCLAWDGCDSQGRPVPAGVYLVEVTATAASGAVSRAVRAVQVR